LSRVKISYNFEYFGPTHKNIYSNETLKLMKEFRKKQDKEWLDTVFSAV